MTEPGWYPDPGGCWEHRWWDGNAWGMRVQTGSFAMDEAPVEHVQAPPDRDQPLATFEAGVATRRAVHVVLTWHTLVTYQGSNQADIDVLPLWMIKAIEVWEGAVKSVTRVGDVRMTIGYEGYVGPNVKVLQNVAEPHWAKAMIWRQKGLALRSQ